MSIKVNIQQKMVKTCAKRGPLFLRIVHISEQNQKYDIYAVLCKPCRVRKAQNFIEPLKWLVYHQPNPVHINGPVNQGLFLSLKICLKKTKVLYVLFIAKEAELHLVNSTYLQSNLYSHHISPYVMQIVWIETSKSKKHS